VLPVPSAVARGRFVVDASWKVGFAVCAKSDELRDSFPRIHRALKIIACVPATQAECERVFSSAGRILTELRSRLSAEHSADLVFLYRNLHEGSKELAECDAEWFYDQHGYPTGNLVHDDDDDDDSAATPSAKRT